MLFQQPLILSCSFCLLYLLCEILHFFICVYCTNLASLGWIKFDHVWTFCFAGSGLPIFCWGIYLFIYLFLNFNFIYFYFYSVTIVCIFSPSLHPTTANLTFLPHLYPPPWFCPCVLYSSTYRPLSPLLPPHSPLAIVTLFLISLSLVILCLLFSSVD